MILINNALAGSIQETVFSVSSKFNTVIGIPENLKPLYGLILMYKEYRASEYEMYPSGEYPLDDIQVISQLNFSLILQPYGPGTSSIGFVAFAIPDVNRCITTLGIEGYAGQTAIGQYYIHNGQVWQITNVAEKDFPSIPVVGDYWRIVDLEDNGEILDMIASTSNYDYYYSNFMLLRSRIKLEPTLEVWDFETSCTDGKVTFVGTSNKGNTFGPLITDFDCDITNYSYELECTEEDLYQIVQKVGDDIVNTFSTDVSCKDEPCEPWQRLKLRMNKCDNFTLIHDGSPFTYYPVLRSYDNPMTSEDIASYSLASINFWKISPDVTEATLDLSRHDDGMYLLYMIYLSGGEKRYVVIPVYVLCAMQACMNKMIKSILCMCDCEETDPCNQELEKQRMYELNKLIAIIQPVISLIRLRVSVDGQILPSNESLSSDYYDLFMTIKKMNLMIDRCGLCNDEELDCGCN